MPDLPRDPVATLLDVLRLEQTGTDVFTGTSHPMLFDRVFGGQVVAQCVAAALETLPSGRPPHSIHGYFLRPGDVHVPIDFTVERIHDGRSFSRRRIQAAQNGVPIFSSIASFQVATPGMEHQIAAPEVPGPDEVPPSGPRLSDRSDLLWENPIEARHIGGDIYGSVPERRPDQATWVRIRRTLPDDPRLHGTILAYMSDFTIQEATLRANGVPWRTEGLRTASLDHALWWHRPARVDEWMLYTVESPGSRGGRGMNAGRIFSQDGELLASVAQEIMVHTPRDRR